MISSVSTDPYIPQRLIFDRTGAYCFVALFDSLRVFTLDPKTNNSKPTLLDFIPKLGGQRDTLDIRINTDSGYIFICDSLPDSPSTVCLSNLSLE